MSQDVFAEWKKQRFISVDPDLVDSAALLVILTDISFWITNSAQLKEWCDMHGAVITGMGVEFKTKQDLTLFTLRWS